jgi:hypothetical protein
VTLVDNFLGDVIMTFKKVVVCNLNDNEMLDYVRKKKDSNKYG